MAKVDSKIFEKLDGQRKLVSGDVLITYSCCSEQILEDQNILTYLVGKRNRGI